MRKIGIMGGTFNPIHTAHLILAETAYEQLGLDKILFMPSKKPPHKIHEAIVSDDHRIRMVQLAIQDNPHFELSYEELNREGITYTADTLEKLSSKSPDDAYYFIMGGDSLFQLETWWKPEKILSLSRVAVAVRGYETIADYKSQIAYLDKKYNTDIQLLTTPNLEISSKDLREKRKQGKSIRYYVPATVYNYIVDNHLYQGN